MNPSPRSPKDVTADPDYEVMSGYFRGHYWPWADEIVVRHKATGTFWKPVRSGKLSMLFALTTRTTRCKCSGKRCIKKPSRQYAMFPFEPL